MPFFRCGGATISKLAEQEILSIVRNIFKDSINSNIAINVRTTHGAYGIVGTGVSFTWENISSLDMFRRLFESIGYTVNINAAKGDDNILWYIKTESTQPDGSVIPGDPISDAVCNKIYTPFSATIIQDSAYDTYFMKAKKRVAKELFGDTFSIAWRAQSYLGTGNEAYQRPYTFSSSGNWASILKSAFEKVGYSILGVNGTMSGSLYSNASSDSHDKSLMIIRAAL
ncbi:MAG: hypothetical protein HDR21_00925 [Lachnospiraceae bacterium]|nr:hypothetical protein [Lachnospiraceae bacterium]MBD5481688.1 hypothetical protein [Lachnospiraceae bacterium]